MGRFLEWLMDLFFLSKPFRKRGIYWDIVSAPCNPPNHLGPHSRAVVGSSVHVVQSVFGICTILSVHQLRGMISEVLRIKLGIFERQRT